MIRVTFQHRPERWLCWDIENRPSAYWYDGQTTSEITAIGWKWDDEDRAHSLVLNRGGRFVLDGGRTFSVAWALRRFRTVLVSATGNYGHNIRKHDLPLFNTALLRQGLPPLPPLRTSDTLRDFPKRKDMSASLENLARLYDLGREKHHMSQVDWERANRLEPAGIEETRERVVSDVLLQEKLRNKLLELGVLGPPKRWAP